MEEDKQIQEITHIVQQIGKLRVNIYDKLQNKRYPDKQVLDVLADAMQDVDNITQIHPKEEGWTQTYTDIKQGRIPEGLCDRILQWQKETLNWVDHMESRRLIQALQEEVNRHAELLSKLGSNYNVQKGWLPEINREKIGYAIEADRSLGITTQKRDRQIIVSLTSYPDRMYEIKYALYSLLNQTLKPDQIILWLAEEQFPGKENDIAPSLLAMKEKGLTIKWCEDIRSYKKLIPALEEYPEEIIVTADDDIYYQENWLELLYNSYLEYPEYIHCHRAHKVRIENNRFSPYNSWEKKVSMPQPSYHAFPTGGGGILYPPHVLYKDICNRKHFMKLAPNADDIWFWAMSVLQGAKIKIVNNGIKNPMAINWAREVGLTDETMLSGRNVNMKENDIYLNNVLEHYPALLSILESEQITDREGWEGSSQYWEYRYLAGGTSGAGSYNRLAEFKARIINQFIREHNIQSVIEWGCGDGNQLKLAEYPQYTGYDVSQEAVKRCKEIFREDTTKEFIWSGSVDFVNHKKGDLALSLDVIYHLVEDDVFELYIKRLFESSNQYVCIYSCNYDYDDEISPHVRCRKFTDYIEKHIPEWELVKVIQNEYPYDEKNPNGTSWSDFYIYHKKA